MTCTEEGESWHSSIALQFILTFGVSKSSPPLLKKDDYAADTKDIVLEIDVAAQIFFEFPRAG